jgi:hypothetical protein
VVPVPNLAAIRCTRATDVRDLPAIGFVGLGKSDGSKIGSALGRR